MTSDEGRVPSCTCPDGGRHGWAAACAVHGIKRLAEEQGVEPFNPDMFQPLDLTDEEREGLDAALKAGRITSSVEWGYRLDDDPYVVRMPSEKHVRHAAQEDPNVTVVRRFISEWEEAPDA